MTENKKTQGSGTPEGKSGVFQCEKGSEKDSFLSELAHQLGHEVGNPLTAIISLSSVMERTLPPDIDPKIAEQISGYSSVIAKEAWRISLLSDRFVHLLSTRAGTPTECAISQVIDGALGRLRKWGKYEELPIHCENIGNANTCYIDPVQFQHLLAELLQNAFEELQQYEGSGLVWVTTSKNKETCTIEISNPCQKTYKELDTLFQPFMKGSKNSGQLGLGLTVCSSIIQRAQGKIELEQSLVEDVPTFTARIHLPINMPT